MSALGNGSYVELVRALGASGAAAVPEPAPPHAAVAAILRAVAAAWRVKVEEIRGRSRRAHLSEARSAAMLLFVNRLKMSASEAGRVFERDASTALYLVGRARDRLARPEKTGDPLFRARLADAEETLGKEGGR